MVVTHDLIKRIGSFLLFFLSCAAQDLSLSVISPRGDSTSVVEVHTPFIIRVAKQGSEPFAEPPVIDGIDGFAQQGSSTLFSSVSINGHMVQEVHYDVSVVASKTGSYVLGPAVADGLISNMLTVEIQESSSEYPAPQVSLQLSADKAYPQQKVGFTIRFAWQNPELRSPRVSLQGTDGITMENYRQTTSHQEPHENGISTHVIEYQGDLYAQAPGNITIGPVFVEYRLPEERIDVFSRFFSSMTRHVVQSKEVSLEVVALPETEYTAQGIGVFSSYTAALKEPTAPQHEAVTLVLRLQGDARFEMIEAPELDLPSTLRWYSSKTVSAKDGIAWVYVLQGLEEGPITIPSQVFTYFDPLAEEYKQLSTSPLELIITPGNPIQQVAFESAEPEEQPAISHAQKTTWPEIPFWLFILLMSIPPCIALLRFVVGASEPYRRTMRQRRRAKTAFKRAVRELENLTDPVELYPLIKKTLAEYVEMPHADDRALVEQLRLTHQSSDLSQKLIQLLKDAQGTSAYAPQEGDASLLMQAKHLLKEASKVFMLVAMVSSVSATTSIDAITYSLSGVPFVVWQLGVVCGWWLLWYGWYKIAKEWWFVVLVCWVSIVAGWALRSRVTYRPHGVVTQETVLRVGPGERYPARALLDPAHEITLVKKQGAWYYISSLQGIGWVREDRVEIKQE